MWPALTKALVATLHQVGKCFFSWEFREKNSGKVLALDVCRPTREIHESSDPPYGHLPGVAPSKVFEDGICDVFLTNYYLAASANQQFTIDLGCETSITEFTIRNSVNHEINDR